ncbi:hypothetical protein Tco_0581056 [Tanacetum coccineum]
MEEQARNEEEYAKRHKEEEKLEARIDWIHPMHWREKANDGSRDGEQVIFQNNTTQPTQQSMIHGEPAKPFDQATHKDTAVDGEHKLGDQATHEDIAVMDEAIHDEPLDNRKGKVVDDTLEPEQPTKKINMQKWQESTADKASDVYEFD